MRRDKMAWIGILSLVGLIAPLSNSANALTTNTDNNLTSKKSLTASADQKSAFLVSKTKILAKYENAPTLSDKDLALVLKAVGFKGRDLIEAWAVAKKESNGQPIRFNGNRKTGDNSYGLFQINMIDDLGPDRRDKFDLRTNFDLLNPVKNAQIAYHMSNGGKDWSAWHGITSKTKFWMKQFPINLV
jgi:hypothetical protein